MTPTSINFNGASSVQVRVLAAGRKGKLAAHHLCTDLIDPVPPSPHCFQMTILGQFTSAASAANGVTVTVGATVCATVSATATQASADLSRPES